jgi:hypothetical protein
VRPEIPDILSRVLELSHQTLDRASGSPKRLDALERLIEDVAAAKEWPTEQAHHYVNDWTAMLLTMLRKIEREAPLRVSSESQRAEIVARALLPLVTRDAAAALEAKSTMLLAREPQGRH